MDQSAKLSALLTSKPVRYRRPRTRRTIRGVMGTEFFLRQRGYRRPAHGRTMGRLYPGARLSLHRRGRSPDRPPCGQRPSLDAGLQRSGLSDRRAQGADGGVREGALEHDPELGPVFSSGQTPSVCPEIMLQETNPASFALSSA
jgi:hypothetical protein